MEEYFGDADTEKFYHIEPQPFKESMKSFTLSKVDNIDLCVSDIRIVDSNGEISNEGRVEMRNNGLWGTVNSKDMNSYAARVICR